MNSYRILIEKKKQVESFEKFFPFCVNSLEAVMLTDQISKLKHEIRDLENMTLSESVREIEMETIYFESQMNNYDLF